MKVKIVRLDRSGEYYERYDENSQHYGLFANFFEKCGTYAQYKMSSTL